MMFIGKRTSAVLSSSPSRVIASTVALFLTTGTEASEQAGAVQGLAIHSAEQNEYARRARRTRAKGGAAHDVPSPPFRQADE